MNYEQIVSMCVELRKTFEQDEAKFFLGLVEVEQKFMSVLKKHGLDNFDQFIRSYELTRVERYRAFATGLGHITPIEARRMGAPAVIALACVRNEKRVPAYVAAVDAWAATHHGLTPRTETAEKILRQVDPRPETPKAVQELSEMARLRAECSALRSELAKAKRENAQLQAKLAKLEGKNKRAQPRVSTAQ